MKNNISFPKIKGKVVFDEPLSRHTTFRVGGRCMAWCVPESEKDLKCILNFARKKKKKIFLMGMGSNVLCGDNGFKGFVAHLGHENFRKIIFSGNKIISGAGVSLNYLIDFLCRKGHSGLEGLAGIPGSLGGAIYMNAGYKGNISDSLESVRVMDKKNLRVRDIKKKNIAFGYRHSNLSGYIILEGTFRLKREDKKTLLKRKKEYMKMRKREQPAGLPNAGCVFKNPEQNIPAALLIEMLGLKGKRIGGAEVSMKHANFIINAKNAKAADIKRLIDLIRKKVKSNFHMNLGLEIITL